MREQIFTSFEERESYIRDQLGSPVPSRHLGPRAFFSDLKAAGTSIGTRRRSVSIVPANPFDCLAFDRVRVVLEGVPGLPLGNEAISGVSRSFALEGLLDRYIYTLSGGEALRLAFAKSALEQPKMDRLAVVAPWNSLSSDGHPYIQKLSSIYELSGKPVDLLSLQGDADFEEADSMPLAPHVQFELEIANLRIPLSNPDRISGFPQATFSEFRSELKSPCRFRGSNGQGKSLLAKALADVIDHAGNAMIHGAKTGRARLVFQDVSSQMLLSASSLDLELEGNSSSSAYLQILENSMRQADRGLEYSIQTNALLSTKIKMIAVRLAGSPSALILDEPDWGLTKQQAVQLVGATAELCDKAEIPLIIISHRQWFNRVFRSNLDFSRAIVNPAGDLHIELKESL